MNTDGPITFTGLIKFLQYIKGPDHWHYVGATGEPAFENSWVNYGVGDWGDVRFMKDAAGVVHIGGIAKDGTNTIFTLPEGYRVDEDQTFVAVANDAVARTSILPTGAVVASLGSNTWFATTCSFYVG